MNGDVTHLGGSDFTLISDGILSNEYVTGGTYTSMGTMVVYSRIYNVSGAYNKSSIKISNSYGSANTGHYNHTFNGTFTFTLPISLSGNYTVVVTPNDDNYRTVTSYGGSDYVYETTADINGNTISITLNKDFYTGQSSGNNYLKIIGLTKN